jgi:flagellar motility protein MotE (MotC chaperone)
MNKNESDDAANGEELEEKLEDELEEKLKSIEDRLEDDFKRVETEIKKLKPDSGKTGDNHD